MSKSPKDFHQYLADGCGRCELGGTSDCKVRSWTKELELLQSVVEQTDLSLEIKWGAPCYTYQAKNILMLSALKSCVTLSFFRGAELNNPENILEKPGENSRFARYIRFTATHQIKQLKPAILSFIHEAIDVEQSGTPPIGTDSKPLDIPEELTRAFGENPALRTAFEALTPGRQRGYLIHFTSAKQSKTRSTRIKKSTAKILAGKGWNERIND